MLRHKAVGKPLWPECNTHSGTRRPFPVVTHSRTYKSTLSGPPPPPTHTPTPPYAPPKQAGVAEPQQTYKCEDLPSDPSMFVWWSA